MKALLLAAGLGTRLRPLTDTVPKCLVPINGRPLLGHWLAMLTDGGAGPLLVNLHYHADKVQDFIASTPQAHLVTTVYEERLLGTAGTLLRNRSFFTDAPLMLIHADNLSRFDVRHFIARHSERPKGCEITMMTFETDTPRSCGIAEVDAQGVVVGFHEKVADPPGNLANGAVYILEPTVFDFLASLRKEEIDFSTEVLPHYLGRIYTFFNGIYHRDIGTMASYRAALQEFADTERRPDGN